MTEIDETNVAQSLVVYKPDGTSDFSISGDVDCDVKDGCLLIKALGKTLYVFGPGQWLNVNIQPS